MTTYLREISITVLWDCPVCEYSPNSDDYLASDELIYPNCGYETNWTDLAPDDQIEELAEAEIHIQQILPMLRNYT